MIGRKTLKSQRARSAHIDKAFSYIIQAVLIVYAVFFIAFWLSHRPSILITDITVVGTRATDATQIAKITRAKLDEPLLYKISRANGVLYPKRDIRASVFESDARIAEVKFSMFARHHLQLAVAEFIPMLLWCPRPVEEGIEVDCYFADADGYIFARAPKYSGHVFLVYQVSLGEGDLAPIGKFLLPKEEFSRVREFLEILKNMGLKPHLVTALGSGDYQVTLEGSWSIIWSSTKESKESAANLELVLRSINEDHAETDTKKLEQIDLRFGNKVFYK